jgi:hypothetical protein
MKSYITLIWVLSIFFFSSCSKDVIDPTPIVPTAPVPENPIEPTTSLMPTEPRSSTSLDSPSSTIPVLDSIVSTTPTPIINITDNGITGVSIGEPIQKMIDTYGKADDSYFLMDGVYEHFLWYIEEGIIVRCEPNKSIDLETNLKIESIELFKPFIGKTTKEIAIGSTKASVIAAYGQPTDSHYLFGDKYSTLYIKFDNSDETVERITIKQ